MSGAITPIQDIIEGQEQRSTNVIWHEEENGEVFGPLRSDQGQVGDVGDRLFGFMDFALSTTVCNFIRRLFHKVRVLGSARARVLGSTRTFQKLY